MAYKLIDTAQARWRKVNAPELVALVRAGAVFHKGKLLERPTDITPEPLKTDPKNRRNRGRLKLANPQTSDSANCQAAAGSGARYGCPKALIGSKVWLVCRQ